MGNFIELLLLTGVIKRSTETLLLFLVFSIAMFVLPLVTFFAVKNILDKGFHITGFPNTAWSVTCAVIVVNLIIMAYAWKAYTEEVEDEDETAENLQPVLSKEDLNLKKDE